jgi:hypothetical protein
VNIRNAARGAIGLTLALLVVGVSPAPSLAVNVQPHAGTVVSDPVQLTANKTTTVVESTLTTGETLNIQMTGWISLSNPGAKTVTVTLQAFMVEDGAVEIVGPDLQATVAARSHTAVPVGLLCDGEPAGAYEVGVQATPSGPLVVTGATQTVIGLSSPGQAVEYLPNASVTSSGKVPVGALGTTVLETTLEIPASATHVITENVLAQGWANVTSASKKAAPVTLDYFMDGVWMASSRDIVGPDRPSSLPVGILCDGAMPGQHTFTVQLRTEVTGVTFRSGFLSVIGMPTNDQIPNVHDELTQSVPLGSGPTPALAAELTVDAPSDTWMGGWLEVENPTGRKATVTVQTTMGGETDGPPVVVTLAAKSKSSVPVGLLCNGEPAGTFALGVTVSSSTAGLTVTGGALQAWAVAAN